MAAITPAPIDAASNDATTAKSTIGTANTTWIHVKNAVDELAGSYSIARLESYNDYRKNTSVLWVIFVLTMTPVPSMALMIAMNFLMMEDPAKGWQANYLFFIRNFFLVLIGFSALRWQRQFYLPRAKTTFKQNAIVTVIASTVYTSVLLLLSAYIAFPMPFGMIMPLAVCLPLMVGILLLVLRKNREKARQSKQNDQVVSDEALKRYKRILVFNMCLLFIYPFYAVGFRKIEDDTKKIFYTLLLPILKIILTHMAKKRYAHVEDVSAESLVFSVELFNALFVSMCLGGTGSTRAVSFFLVAIDFTQIATIMGQLTKRAGNLVRNRQNFTGNQPHDIVDASLKFAYENRPLVSQMDDIRWEASNGLRFRRFMLFNTAVDKIQTEAQRLMLANQNLNIQDLTSKSGGGAFTPARKISTASSSTHPKKVAELVLEEHVNKTLPATNVPVPSGTSVRAPINNASNTNHNSNPTMEVVMTEAEKKQMQILRQTLGIMFAMEKIVLVEYVEAFIPYFYSLYVYAMFHCPNVVYLYGFEQMVTVNTTTKEIMRHEEELVKSLNNMVFYGTLELASIIVLYFSIKWRFNLNVFYHLSFVLETHFTNIQGKLTFFLMQILGFTLKHYGMDFSFDFLWLKHAMGQQ